MGNSRRDKFKLIVVKHERCFPTNKIVSSAYFFVRVAKYLNWKDVNKA